MKTVAWLSATCITLASSAATAQVREPDNFLSATVMLSAPKLRDDGATRHVSPTLSAGFKLSEHSQLRLDWGLPYTALGTAGGGGWSHVGSSNLLVGLHLTGGAVGDSAFVRLGAAAALPLALREGGDSGAAAEGANYAAAAAVRGLADPWLWALDTTSLVLPLSAGLDLPGFQFRADVALGMMMPVSRASERTHLVGQASVEASVGLGVLEPGVRAQAVSTHLTDETWRGDDAQLSVEPFVRARLGAGFARAGLRIDLDRPQDSGGGGTQLTGRMWALGVGAGIGF
jgi:hypothetical protein